MKLKLFGKKINLNEVKEKNTIKTRQYAKRQNTWARGQMMNLGKNLNHKI